MNFDNVKGIDQKDKNYTWENFDGTNNPNHMWLYTHTHIHTHMKVIA
jgi:hypothetical protein